MNLTKICEHPGCKTKIKQGYRFCYIHRKDTYTDKCPKHGITKFKEGKCLKCKKLTVPMYRIHKRGNNYYFNKNKKPLPKNYFMSPYYRILIKRTAAYQKKFIGRITKGPGTYGIFIRTNRGKLKIGKCLYVGQSTDVSRRIKEHRDALKIASKDLHNVKKINKKLYLIDRRKLKVPLLYYRLAEYGATNLKFVKLQYIDKRFWQKLTLKEALTCLSFFEQLGMDAFNPELNTIAARNTDTKLFSNK